MTSKKTAAEETYKVSTRPICLALAPRSQPMRGKDTATADTMNGIRKSAEQTASRTADRETLDKSFISFSATLLPMRTLGKGLILSAGQTIDLWDYPEKILGGSGAFPVCFCAEKQ
jgi:hypothetical protein